MVKSKLLSLLMSVLIIFFLVACTPGEELDIDALLLEAEEQVELAGTVTSDLELPTSVVVDDLTIEVSWSSSNTAVISNTGQVTRPSAATGNVSVTLTATFTYLEEEKIGTFVVVVEALAAVSATVTFNSNEGTAVASISATQGSTITAPTPPTKANHTFGGWYKEAALTNAWNFATDVVNANLTLYAKWVENESFEVTFNKGNGEDNVLVSVYTGQKVTAIEDPATPGYTFSYWSKANFEEWDFDVDVVTEDLMLYAFYEIITYTITYVIPNGAELTTGTTSYDVITPVTDFGTAFLENHEFLGWFTAATGGMKVTSLEVGTTGNQTLYAQFEEDEQFTVTFNDMHGGITSETLYYGYVDEPTDPIRSGYLFLGWFKDMEGLDAYDFEFDLVSADITLYAMWEKLVPEGMTGVHTAEEFYQMTLHTGTDAFFLMNPIDFSNYTWVAHNNSFKGIFDGDHQLISNLSIESTDSANYGGIFPRANGATIQNLVVEDLYIDVVARAGGLIGRVENGKVTLQDISLHHVHVRGTANEGVALLIGQASFEVEIDHVSISASKAFTTNKYASLFIGRSDVLVSANDIFIRDSVAEITATNTDAGASGIVSYTNNDNAHVNVERLVIVDSYLHGKSAGAIVGYLNRGTVSVNHAFVEVTFTYMDAPNSGLVSRVNTTGVAPTFTNLFVDLNFENPTHAQVVASTPAIHQELDALDQQFWLDHLTPIASSVLWTYNLNYYKLSNDHIGMVDQFEVTFNVDGGTLIPSYVLLTGNKAFVPVATTKAEHIFDGFYKDALHTMPFDFNTELITADTTIYVKWIEMDKFDVAFDSNGGSTVEPMLNVLDGSLILAPTAPTRLGYTFVGWFKDMELADEFSFDTDIVVTDITLYAKWEVVEYTITYHLNGGEATNPLTYTIETPSFDLTQATKLGYTFDAWTTAEVEGSVVTEVLLGTTGNLHFYAQYDANTYTIDYMLDGGTLIDLNPTTYQITSETLLLNGATKEGYSFDGWYDAETEGTMYSEIESGTTGNLTLYARFYELVTLNFYDEQPVGIVEVLSNTMFPNTMFALSDDNKLFVKGNNDHGLLADGTITSSNKWLNATEFFDLLEGEVILSVQLIDLMAVAHTSQNRFFIWGFFNVDEDIELHSSDPLDITMLFDFSLGEPSAYYNFGTFFIVETTDSRLLLYQNMAVTDITPALGVGEVLAWAPNYGFNNIPHSTVIDTGSRVLMLNPFDLSMLYDVTLDLNLPPAEEVYAVLSQEFAVHVLTETKYNFATFTGDEMNPVMAMNIDLTISFNPLETISLHFGGGGFVTSDHRLLVPVYIVDDEESEMPSSIKYFDVTSQLMLAESETIVATYDPFFILTSLGRVLLVQNENNFTVDPMAEPELMVIDMELDVILDQNEYFMDLSFVGYEIYMMTNKGMYWVVFGQESLELEKLTISDLGLVFSDIYAVNMLDSLYQPENRLYEAFTMWYIDLELTTPLSPFNVYDGMILYPGWEKTHYFITFELYGGSTIPKMAVEMGQIPIAPADPVMEHNIFNGWYYYDDLEGYQPYDFSYEIGYDVIMYASFMTVQYDVTFQFETEDPIVTQAYAYTSYGDLTIEVPLGYEVVAVYLDEDMLIPFDPELQVLGNVTLYVAIDQVTIDLYYYHDMENVSFLDLFATDIATYGFASDGRIFAWGSNNDGGLGIGFDHISQVYTPLDITPLFNLAMGEEITQTYALYSNKVFITNLGRVIAWGYPDPDYNFFGTPQDITSKFNFEVSEEIVDVYLVYNAMYVFTDLGNVYIFDYQNDVVYDFSTTLDFVDVMHLDSVNFNQKDIVIVIPSGAYQLTSTISGDAAVETILNPMFDDEIFKVEMNFSEYNVFYVYTKEGRVYLYNHNNLMLTESFDLELNEFDTLVEVFNYSWNYKLYLTSSDRLYEHVEGITTEYDLSLLAMGEKLMYLTYSSEFYTNFGNIAYMDTFNQEISYMVEAFDLGLESVLYYISVDFVTYAYTTGEIYISSGEVAFEFEKAVGYPLLIEQYVYGDLFELATPIEKPGFDFDGWYDDSGMLYEGIPVNDMMLYAYWSQTPE